MKTVFLILIASTLTGCASVNVTPPQQHSFDTNREYSLPFEKAWVRAVDWFADHNEKKKKIEKSSGLLTAKYLIEANSRLLDCGDIQVSGTLGSNNIEKYGSLNVTVRERGDEKTRVNVNFFGEYKLQAKDAWDGRIVTNSGRCVSTGSLESSILNYIGS